LKDIKANATGLVKIFVSSRREPDVIDHFGGSLNLEIEATQNYEDIRRYVTVEVEERVKNGRLLRGKVSDSLKAEIQRLLLERANGM
jgi:ankyrin repeat domain-containing protein 50